MYALFRELSECIQLGFLILGKRMSFVCEDLKLSLLTWLLIIHTYDMIIIWVIAIHIFVSFSCFLICFMPDNFRHIYNALASYSSPFHSLTPFLSFWTPSFPQIVDILLKKMILFPRQYLLSRWTLKASPLFMMDCGRAQSVWPLCGCDYSGYIISGWHHLKACLPSSGFYILFVPSSAIFPGSCVR